MEQGGTLTVETACVDYDGRTLARIIVSDTGPGIAEKELEKIFSPFHTTKTQGTGLGLAICRRLMEQQGGSIRVESRLGEGSVFTIEIPVPVGETANCQRG